MFFGEGHTPRFTFLATHKLMMIHYLQWWAWRPERDMKEWHLGGQPDLLPATDSYDLMNDSDVSMES